MGLVESSMAWSSHTFITRLHVRVFFALLPKFSGDLIYLNNRNILIINVKNQNLAPKIVGKLGHKLTAPNILDEWNGYPEHFRLSGTLEISRRCLLLRTIISQELIISHWVPLINLVYQM